MPTVGQGNQISVATQVGVGVVTSSGILDGTIVNADVSGTAAIAYSKLALAGSIVLADLNASIGITEAYLTLANNTTGNVSTARHGFAPILPNDATQFLNGVGAYAVPAASTKVFISTTQQVINATTETTIYSFSLGANTLGTNGAIRGRIFFSFANADTNSKIVNVKYGGTQIAQFQATPNAATAQTYRGYIEFMIMGDGGTSAQKGNVVVSADQGVLSTTGAVPGMGGGGSGTAAIDSTSAQTVLISWNNGGGTTVFTAEHIVVDKIV